MLREFGGGSHPIADGFIETKKYDLKVLETCAELSS
jgi:hypothetical protein